MQPGGGKVESVARLSGPIVYEESSWGSLLLRWQINPDGSGEIWRGSGPAKSAGVVRKFQMTLPPDGLRAFAAQIEPLRTATRKPLPCTRTITDLPYGSVTWGEGANAQKWSFDRGCRSSVVDEAMTLLGRANAAIELTAKVDPQPYAVVAPDKAP